MHAKMGCCFLLIGLAAGTVAAQSSPATPDTTHIYCSGMVTTEQVPVDTYMISGEQSNYKMTFAQGDLVYINKGSTQGVKVGDEYLVMRPVKEQLNYPWFGWRTPCCGRWEPLTGTWGGCASSACNPRWRPPRSFFPAATCSAATSCGLVRSDPRLPCRLQPPL